MLEYYKINCGCINVYCMSINVEELKSRHTTIEVQAMMKAEREAWKAEVQVMVKAGVQATVQAMVKAEVQDMVKAEVQAMVKAQAEAQMNQIPDMIAEVLLNERKNELPDNTGTLLSLSGLLAALYSYCVPVKSTLRNMAKSMITFFYTVIWII